MSTENRTDKAGVIVLTLVLTLLFAECAAWHKTSRCPSPASLTNALWPSLAIAHKGPFYVSIIHQHSILSFYARLLRLRGSRVYASRWQDTETLASDGQCSRFQSRSAAQGIRLRGGGEEAAGETNADTLAADDADAENAPAISASWKDMVNSQTRVPFEIMGSPLLPDEELQRIQRLRHEERGDLLEPAGTTAEEDSLYAQPRVSTGPNGTYGPPDLTGRRWRALQPSGKDQVPYPRVALRYRVNKTLATTDENLRISAHIRVPHATASVNDADSSALALPANNATANKDEQVYVEEIQDEFSDDETADGFFRWYAKVKDDPAMQEKFAAFYPPPNLTLAPWSRHQVLSLPLSLLALLVKQCKY
jgi:hypothetical protein